MIDQKFFRFTIIVLLIISSISSVLSYFKIPYQFYVWEFYIDLKIVGLLLLLLFLNNKKAIQFPNINQALLKWNWKKNILFFSLPPLVFIISIVSGLIFNQVLFNKLDNTLTLLLSTIFDIPAIFVFSFTSILIEEIFFRGFIFITILQKKSRIHSIVLTSAIWVIYSFSEIIGTEEINSSQSFLIVFFFLSVGILCCTLMDKYKSVWFGYSLRIGIIALSPIIITSLLLESDSFFSTESVFFYAEGIVTSALMIVVSFLISRAVHETPMIKQEILEI